MNRRSNAPALHGLLAKVRDIGTTLLSVEVFASPH
jgi:hypothetical protein